MRPLILFTFCLSLASCVVMPAPPTPEPVADLATCGGNSLRYLTGLSVTALPADGAWGTVRVIKPGMAVTGDYSESRLNVRVDSAGSILSLSCG